MITSTLATFSDDQKIRVILATGECGYNFDYSSDDPVWATGIHIYELDSLRELAEQFIEEGLFGEIPNIRYYLDLDAIARDLAMDYSESPSQVKTTSSDARKFVHLIYCSCSGRR